MQEKIGRGSHHAPSRKTVSLINGSSNTAIADTHTGKLLSAVSTGLPRIYNSSNECPMAC